MKAGLLSTTSRRHVWDLFCGGVGFRSPHTLPPNNRAVFILSPPLSHLVPSWSETHISKHGVKGMVCDIEWLFSVQNKLASESKQSHRLGLIVWFSTQWPNQSVQSWEDCGRAVRQTSLKIQTDILNYSQAGAESVWLANCICVTIMVHLLSKWMQPPHQLRTLNVCKGLKMFQ